MVEEKYRRRCEDAPLTAPNAEGNVWPKQYCPAFLARESLASGLCQCWYCCYADFHLNKEKALDVGICCWPKKIMK